MRLFASSSAGAWLLGLVVLAPAVVSAGLDHGGWGFGGTTYDYDNNDYGNDYGAPVSDVVVGPSDQCEPGYYGCHVYNPRTTQHT
jgi:hypothetical protein